MRIGIEGQRLFRQNKHGMDFVALELVKNIQELDHQNEYVVFVKPDEDVCLQSSGNMNIIELGGGPYPTWEQCALPHAVQKYRCDLLHCTSNTAPLYNPVPMIVTVHDIFHLENISLFRKGFSPYQKFGNMYRRYIVPGVVKRAKRILTVSESEKKRILQFFHLQDEQVSVVYNGVSKIFKPVTDQGVLEKIRLTYGLPGKYMLFLGNTDPKKNTKGVLTAFARYIHEATTKIPIVIADYPQEELERILQEIREPDLMPFIHRLDYVNNADLPGIYTMASLFLYPSFRESFGIPILEAMSCGTPVITSNVFAMPEVAGQAALLIDPTNPNDLASAIHNVLTEPGLSKSLSERGFVQATRFSWAKMAQDYMEIYKELVDKTASRT
ncbi:MAG: glycosyltransferase family 1 protein [Bacteroidetes bacterium]|nr:MAG: glycosyltransferase family 1 protein [Bacteroidota bacterium]